LILIDSDGDLLKLPVQPAVNAELYLRLRAAIARVGTDEVSKSVADAVLHVAISLAEADRRRPTAAQLKYALDISKKLGVEVPSDAFSDRARMGAFLSLYASAPQRSPTRTRKKG
jgi:hypothetical protein